MKAQYFTKKNIGSVAEGMLKELNKYAKNIAPKIVPDALALLIIDMQDYFILDDGPAFVPSASAIIPGINKLKQLFLDNNLPVILTQHINTTENAGMMMVRWKELMHKDHPYVEIHSEIKYPGCEILVKPQFDAFYGTSLEDDLKKKGITQLVITGVMTNLCCETTVRSAFVRGFEPFFPIDGTAAYNSDFHMSTFRNLSYGFTNPVLMNEFINKIFT